MPPIVPDPSEYYNRHESSNFIRSQTNLSSQAQDHRGYSTDQSTTLLPATTYGQSSRPPRSRTPSLSQSLSRINTSVDAGLSCNQHFDDQTSANPDDFYRVTLTPPALHQDALRAATVQPRSQPYPDGNNYSRQWSTEDLTAHTRRDDVHPRGTPGLKGRKSSVKNLVAQINASSVEDPPPLPTPPLHSIPFPRNTSGPISMYQTSSTSIAGAQVAPQDTSSHPTLRIRHSMGGEGMPRSSYTQNLRSQSSQNKRPLFGEVFLNPPQQQPTGYSVLNPRRRAGSESSPMHSPNSMFPPERRDSQSILLPAAYHSSPHKPDHRRANSDLPRSNYHDETITEQEGFFASPDSAGHTPISSKIPIAASRLTSFEQGDSVSIPRTISSLDKRTIKTEPEATSTRNRSPKPPTVTGKSNRPKITSPSRRGNAPNAAHTISLNNNSNSSNNKNASLRANIIAPPPKISPPLRSSRPRLPVSNASTAASRARMAEKFNAMQKLNNEKRASQRRPHKPPELTDIDLKARRLRITQALTRSREGEDLKGTFQTGRRWEPGRSQSSSPQLNSNSSSNPASNIPKLRVADTDGHINAAGQESSFGTHGDEQQMHAPYHIQTTRFGGSTDSVIMDFPTIGRNELVEKPTMHLQTSFSRQHSSEDLPSAITVATEATDIDPEPQEHTRPSLLSHVLELRDQSPSDQYDTSSQVGEYRGDRADVESVNLILRDTTYLDEEEAFRKGYITALRNTSPLREANEDENRNRDSWTSLEHNEVDDADADADVSHEEMHIALDVDTGDEEEELQDLSLQDRYESYRETMASDAYTIINIVLQEHSSSGIVDQQFADDVYQKVLETCPEAENEEYYDPQRIEELCLQEISRREGHAYSAFTSTSLNHTNPSDANPHTSQNNADTDQGTNQGTSQDLPTGNANLLALPPIKNHGHRYKSSLDSAEDWADTSPSISNWMRFASDQDSSSESSHADAMAPEDQNAVDFKEEPQEDTVHHHQSEYGQSTSTPPIIPSSTDDPVEPEEFGTAIIRAPSRSPPPPPKDYLPSIDQSAATRNAESLDAALKRPNVPNRSASLIQGQNLARTRSSSRPTSIRSQNGASAFETQDQPGQPISEELRQFKRRKHVLGELIDTENTYQKDMRIICDIYKQTSPGTLTDEDIRILFGNVEQLSRFARDFFTTLKQAAKPTYHIDKGDRKKEKNDGLDGLKHNSSSSTLASAPVDDDANEQQRDFSTRIGEAFERSLAEMEVVYTEYIRNRHAANQKLEALQRSPEAQKWLKECWDNSCDITQAWNLDALLVKPVQRITKYPLLLKELVDSSPEGHPDLPTLRRVMNSVTDINMRINEVKKHAEMLDSVLNRKRGQSDVRAGISKAFGRRAEKLRQHVGITDMYEDPEYDKLRVAYDNNYVHLAVVADDCTKYERGISHWVGRMVEMATAMEAWVDVAHTHHQQEESKLRHLAMIIRNVNGIALPDHIDHLRRKVIQPMNKAFDMLTRFKDDPKGLMAKREKRLVDYAQMKNRKERGEKVDRKMAERMDQWEALNTEVKERIRKLLRATAHLVQTCQGHFIQLQMTWMAMIQQKFSSVMGINLKHISLEEIQRDWQANFDYQEASALTLGICNGSLMMQAANMTSFLSPGTTLLNGEDSPRQVSISSAYKRSASLHSESSNIQGADFASRPTDNFNGPLMPDSQDNRPYSYANGRIRATSTASGQSPRNPDAAMRPPNKHASISASFIRPGTSPGMAQEVFAPPRLSVETSTPLLSEFQIQSLPDRPVSTSTFFSAPAGPSHTQSGQRSAGGSIFSSALPMSDSPTAERHPVDMMGNEPKVLFTAASVYEFNIDRARREAGFPYLTYVTGEIFDVIGERGELWLAKNQDDPHKQIGWIWNKHFAKLAE